MNDTPLNAAQMAAVKKEVHERFTQYLSSLQLRKWAMEQALTRITSTETNADLVRLAAAIYDFVATDPPEPPRARPLAPSEPF